MALLGLADIVESNRIEDKLHSHNEERNKKMVKILEEIKTKRKEFRK